LTRYTDDDALLMLLLLLLVVVSGVEDIFDFSSLLLNRLISA
jgi:hypothetical protein